MRKASLFFFVMCICVACVHSPVSVRLYGVSGPNEGRIIEGKAIRTGHNSGRIEITLPDGEYFTGEYSVIMRGSSTFSNAQWSGVYSTVYGSGFSVSREHSGEGMGTAIGNKGTVLEVNFVADRHLHGFGVAKDNKGNIYRVQF